MAGRDIKAFAWRPSLAIFGLVVLVYALAAGSRLWQPSPQFHFVDLAQSFLDGRLDTDTPRQRSQGGGADDPRGYRAAIARTEKAGGWNDWAYVERLTLKDGEVLKGRFPWAADRGEKGKVFYAQDGQEYRIERHQDIARTCGPSGRSLCIERDYFVSFPPFPAVALMPAVAVWGYDTNDVAITVLVGGLNAVLMFWFLQLLVLRGHSLRSREDNIWLTLAFALGTVVFFSTVRGEVWFSALVFGVAINLSFMLAALDLRHPVWAGVFLGLGFATRTPILFCGAFFAWQLLVRPGAFSAEGWAETVKKGVAAALPLGAILAGLMVYNQLRFGSPTEFGHAYLQGSAYERVRDFGMFSGAYLNRNLLSALVSVPRFSTEAPYVMVSTHGLSLTFTTPLLLLLLWPLRKPRLSWALWAAVIAAALPGLFYQNTGWVQFGFRFAMDYLPYLFALIAIGGRPLGRGAKALILWGVAVNLFGAITFGRYWAFYYETLFPGAT